jgi:hypothetical protein
VEQHRGKSRLLDGAQRDSVRPNAEGSRRRVKKRSRKHTGSKTMPPAFFLVNMKGRYNMSLGHDWIHANGCVPSTLHQCVVQWVRNQVEIMEADDIVSHPKILNFGM